MEGGGGPSARRDGGIAANGRVRSEGVGFGSGNERKDGEKGEKGEEKGEEADEGGGDGAEYGASGVSVRSVSEWEGNRGDSLFL